MANAVEICNLALSFLGDRATVASINPPEQTAQAQMCATYYPIARSALLEMHDWSFATKRAILARLDDEDDSGWNGVYQLPSDTMHVIRVKPYGTENPLVRDGVQYPFFETNPTDCRFDVLGRKLYTNAENPVAHYVSSEVSEGALCQPRSAQARAFRRRHARGHRRADRRAAQRAHRSGADRHRRERTYRLQ